MKTTLKADISVDAGYWRDLMIDIYAHWPEGWKRFNTITNHIFTDPVDNYLVYKLIEPGYES